jgi:hypothetical protein
LKKFGETFSAADQAKWKNTLAWAVVASRNERFEDAMQSAGLPAYGGVYLARVKPSSGQVFITYSVGDTDDSKLLRIAKKQLAVRQSKALRRKRRIAPNLDPKKPWTKCPTCNSMTYLALKICVRCQAKMPVNTNTKVFRG